MIKVEDTQSRLCMACLCIGRSLNELRNDKLKQYYLDTLNEIPLCNKPLLPPVVCWECEALLKKVLSFREQVKDSYRILQTYSHENLYECLVNDVSRPPRLKVHINSPIIISPNSEKDNLPKEEVKIEINEVVSDTQNKAAHDHSSISKHDTSEPRQGLQEAKKERKKTKQHFRENSSNNHSTEKTHLSRMKMHVHKSDLCAMETKDLNATVCLEVKFENKDLKEEQSIQDLEDCPDDVENDSISQQSEECETDTSIKVKLKEKNTLKVNKQRVNSTVKNKLKNAKKIVKRLHCVKKKQPERESQNEKILTLDLTYEEMLAEREKESKRDSYIQAQYKCETCLIGFHYSKSFRAHLVAKHSPFVCIMKLMNEFDMKLSFVGISQDIGDYSCPICKTIISSVESFTAHYKRHMRRYECSVCHKRTLDIKAMQQHYYSTHEISLKEYKCNLCGQISNSIDTHRYHKDTHKARVQCDECDKTFSHRAGLMNHRLAVHELQNEFPCTICDKVFRWKTSLKRHLEKHDNKTKATAAEGAFCVECDIGFSSVCSLQRHLRNSLKHVTHDQLKFICDHCNRRFADKTKLRDHIEEKHLHRTYQCHICQKTSKNRVGLEQHVRNVHKGRPNNKMCHHCAKGFPTKVQLESHIRTHTGERPFICEYCPTTFSQQSNLYKHHRQVHLNIKSKRYPLCNKKKVEGMRTDNPPHDVCANENYPVITGMYSAYYT